MFHRVFAAAIVALALAAVAQAAPSSSSAAAYVKTTYLKGVPVGVTIKGDRTTVDSMCKGITRTEGFTPCRRKESRYRATACAWRLTYIRDNTFTVVTVTTTQAMLPVIRPRVCPALVRIIRGNPDFRAVRIK